MIFKNTFVRTADNSGAKMAEIIKVLKVRYQHAKLADHVIVAVKTAYADKKVKRHDVCKGVIIRMRKTTSRRNGLRIKFHDNAIVLFDKRKNIAGTRIFGPVAHELRQTKHTKILVMAICTI